MCTRVTEVTVYGDRVHLIRRREQVADLFAMERLLPYQTTDD
ncbi:MAG TPA: hypothetical protein VFH21_06680 [Burkholderiales bacterium]|nr:hypothetical protein [Burkholderiales bacterium]